MLKGLFECKTCKAYRNQIEYLEKIIDRLLVKLGSAPITEKSSEDIEPPDEAEKILNAGGIIYGE